MNPTTVVVYLHSRRIFAINGTDVEGCLRLDESSYFMYHYFDYMSYSDLFWRSEIWITSFKTPFIVLCALILTAGAVGYQRSPSERLRWIFLLLAAALALAAASHAANAFWNMTSELGYVECFPDYTGCAPLTGQEPTWLSLFFSF